MLVLDGGSLLGTPKLLAAPTFMGFMLVETVLVVRDVNLGVQARAIHQDRIGPDKQFRPVTPDQKYNLQSILNRFREEAVSNGATPEAVTLLDPILRFDDKEKAIMAEKLTKKPAAKAAPKAAAAKPKGNPEALAKAREAKAAASAGPDKRKISVVKKPHGAREGTTRATLLDTIYKSKTVQDAVDAGIKKSDVAWAARGGYIALN
jgi:hypothetical protein